MGRWVSEGSTFYGAALFAGAGVRRRAEAGARAESLVRAGGESESYLEQLGKNIPAEVVAAWVVADGAIQSAKNVSPYFIWIVFGILLVLAALYRLGVGRNPGAPVPVIQVAIAPIAFALWVLATGGPFTQFSWWTPVYGAVFLSLFTATTPLFAPPGK